MANPRKPSALKSISGTDRPCRAEKPVPVPADAELVHQVPVAPDWLPNGHAVAEWNRLAPILVNCRLLTVASVPALGHLCALHGKIVQLYAAGESPTASMIGALRNLFNDFGMSPVAQGKVRGAPEEHAGNKFSGNGSRKSA